MQSFVFKFLAVTFMSFMQSFTQAENSFPAESISIYSETFGDSANPAILLNAGAGNQAITWPDGFCKDLAARGYFVIRYDYRDCGLSSEVDYEKNPYTVLDLAKDAVGVLKKYGVKKATFVGFSMGGQIAQIAAAHMPDYVSSIVLLASSSDFEPGFKAFEGIFSKEGLSLPDKTYVAWATRKIEPNTRSFEEKVADYVETWRLLDGSTADFDEEFFKEQGRQVLTRSKLQQPYLAHAKAMKASFDLHKKACEKINVPTLIIQGGKDPVFPKDHGMDLHQRIKGSKLLLWDDFAHAISPRNFNIIIEAIDEFVRSAN